MKDCSFNSKYAILNYQSHSEVIDKPNYVFWFTSSIIRIIADKPFARHDLALIKDVTKRSPTEWCIEVEIIGDPKIEPEARKIIDESEEEIPTLIFTTTKIYLHKDSELLVEGDENVEILLNCSSIKDGNKSYTVAALVKGKKGGIQGFDKSFGTSLEWLITDSPEIQ